MPSPEGNGTSLGGQVAVVTGGTSGIGAEIAVALARAGAAVVVNSRNAERCSPVVQRIADLAAALEHFGRLDIAVNNAGLQEEKAFPDRASRTGADSCPRTSTARSSSRRPPPGTWSTTTAG